MRCTYSECETQATKIMAWSMGDGHKPCVFVAPYCDDHADEVEAYQGAVFACGPALSGDASKIEGIRR